MPLIAKPSDMPLIDKYEELLTRMVHFEEQINALQSTIVQYETDINDLKATIVQLASTITQQQSSINILIAKNTEQSSTIDNLKSNISKCDNRISDNIAEANMLSTRDRTWKIKYTLRMTAVEEQLTRNMNTAATFSSDMNKGRQLEASSAECVEPSGPQLFVDGVCSCVEDLLIANHSVSERLTSLEENQETINQLTSNVSGIWTALAGVAHQTASSSASDTNGRFDGSTVDFSRYFVYRDVETNEEKDVSSIQTISTSAGAGWSFENRDEVTVTGGFGQMTFQNVQTVNCIGENACYNSIFINVTNLYCEGEWSCGNSIIYGLESGMIIGTNALRNTEAFNVKSLECDDGGCDTTYLYGLDAGTTSSPVSTLTCLDGGCSSSFVYNFAVVCDDSSNPYSVNCGTTSGCSPQSGVFTGADYCYD